MVYRVLSLAIFAVALMSYMATPVLAADTHEGVVIKAGNGELKMSDKDGKNEHTHMVSADAKILRNGKAASLEDLQKGDHVTVTTKSDGGKKTVVKIEAKSKIS